ncbi:unnamed protein product [Linum tenue]|uniref:Uncharacterized protein n=1 Tax=Linum tenue TaxID=586396 RepID=A0AAV0N8Q6_9ROSI|nr:unnamed protein product [Linum tenue]
MAQRLNFSSSISTSHLSSILPSQNSVAAASSKPNWKPLTSHFLPHPIPLIRLCLRSTNYSVWRLAVTALSADASGKKPLLEVKIFKAVIAETGQEILKGVNLVVNEGELGGSVIFKGENLLDMEPEDRSLSGLLSFESPVEIPGVSNIDFLNMAYNARRRKLGIPELGPIEFYAYLFPKLELMNMTSDFRNRNVSEGFSGGERKRNEILQLEVLEADLSVLDEIDSGLDADALQDVAKAVNGLLTPKKSVLMVTHYRRLLEFIQPSYGYTLSR